MPFKERLGDRRSDLRFEIIGQLWGSLETIEHLSLRNLGRGGALVESRRPLTNDTIHGVRLLIGEEPRDLQVRVCHVTPVHVPGGEHYLIGLEFIDLNAQALDQIDRVLSASLNQRVPIAEV